MSKVRINELAREMEVKSSQVLDILAELGLAGGKTHSSSLEEHEAQKVRAQFERGSRPSGHASAGPSRAPQTIAPKIDLSHISKPGDVLKAIQANKQKEEQEARQIPSASRPKAAPAEPAKPAPSAAAPVAPSPHPGRPEPRKVVPQPRQAPPIVAAPPAPPAIASRPPAGPVVAKARVGIVAAPRPAVVVAPPPVAVVVKPPVAPGVASPREEQPQAGKKPAAGIQNCSSRAPPRQCSKDSAWPPALPANGRIAPK